ncbi:DUF2637 domain-containing protein [Actinacidiphila oryziradicis]|uniref:DUF2637 domain-containing protein n=1 Tax=Actinacidiphila oryziradicis TaxID=2571141 RepID=UPI0026B7CD4B
MTVGDSPRQLGWGAQRAIATVAAVLTLALTAVAFWLSYAHLHDLAGRHQLHGGRAWAWPATVDLFIAIGELLVLRASLAARTDAFAVALTAVGSIGSIALNVAAAGAEAGVLDYVVAAVPPVAALLAFGALMRQIHGHLAASSVLGPVNAAEKVDVVTAEPTPPVPVVSPSLPVSAADATRQNILTVAVKAKPRDGEQSPHRVRSEEIVRSLYDSLGGRRPGTRHIVSAFRQEGLPASDGTARETRKRVEAVEPELKLLPPA